MRVAGPTRWTTATALAEHFRPLLTARPDDIRRVAVASGEDGHLVDALAGGSLGALTVLTPRTAADPSTVAFLNAHRLEIGRLNVLGGEAAIGADVLGALNGALNGWPSSG